MRCWGRITLAVLGLSAAPLSARCPDATEGAGVVRQLGNGQDDMNLIVSMSMLPKILHLEYPAEVSRRMACPLATFRAGGDSYQLGADAAEHGPDRVATSDHKGAPVAELLPVFNILEMVDAAKRGKSAQTRGYLLAVLTPSDFTGWRYYTDVPNQATLETDIAAALDNRLPPLFRSETRTDKVTIFVQHPHQP